MVGDKSLPKLKELLQKEKVALLGVGNPLRGDDAVGSWIAEELKGKVKLPVFVGEDVPENYLYEIIAAGVNCLLLIDAVDFGGEAGEVRLIDTEELTPRFISTHGISLNIMASLLKGNGCDVMLLGIQPKEMAFAREMSEEVKRSAEEIISLFRSWLG